MRPHRQQHAMEPSAAALPWPPPPQRGEDRVACLQCLGRTCVSDFLACSSWTRNKTHTCGRGERGARETLTERTGPLTAGRACWAGSLPFPPHRNRINHLLRLGIVVSVLGTRPMRCCSSPTVANDCLLCLRRWKENLSSPVNGESQSACVPPWTMRAPLNARCGSPLRLISCFDLG